jgi:DNA polymerase III epsilon subunit-like protein
VTLPTRPAALAGRRLAVVDLETGGWSVAEGHGVIEVARVVVEDGAIVETWSSLVRSPRPVSAGALAVTGITEADLAAAPEAAAVAPALRAAVAGLPLAFHNAAFDLPFLQTFLADAGQPPLHAPVLDTLGLARGLFGGGTNDLPTLTAALGVAEPRAHRAADDARATARTLIALAARWELERGVRTLAELAAASQDALRAGTRRRDTLESWTAPEARARMAS